MKLRPNASAGRWLAFLLPTALLWTTIRNRAVVTPFYGECVLFASGFFLTAIGSTSYFPNEPQRYHKLKWSSTLFLALFYYFLSNIKHITTNVFIICEGALVLGLLPAIVLHYVEYFFFSVWQCGLQSIYIIYGFSTLYAWLLDKCPQNFTLGEGAVVTQTILLFFYTLTTNLFNHSNQLPITVLTECSLIIQVILLGVAFMCWTLYMMPKLRTSTLSFYTLAVFTAIALIYLPLNILLRQSPIVWLHHFLLTDVNTLKMCIYWLLCTICAIAIVRKQIGKAQKASTRIRKIFHLLAVAVYLPGLISQCSLLYLASGIALTTFILLELMRIVHVWPLADSLQAGFTVYSDDKDVGVIAFTPIYLLIGCSMPLWLHPAPCDLTDSAASHLLPMLSGLLSIGIGDTCASLVGSTYGRHHWKGSRKTIEGTVGSIVSQLLVVGLLEYFRCIEKVTNQHWLQIAIAITISSIVEAKTDQIDNLVLPLIMFILLT